MSAVLRCIYLAWKHPRRWIELIFQDCQPAFSTTNMALRASKRLRSTLNRTLTSPDSVASPRLQWAQFFVAFILPGSTHAARSSSHFTSVDPLFHHEHGLASGQRGWGARWIARWLHPTVKQAPGCNERSSLSRLYHLEASMLFS